MNDIRKLLTIGVEEVIVKEHLETRLRKGDKLRVKFGIDPTAPDLHLGHTIPLRKLRQFQDAGHKAVLIIGDFTAMIGDPTGRSQERKPLSYADVKNRAKKYLKQASLVLNLKKTEVHYNSEWLRKEAADVSLEIAKAGTVQQLLHREDFRKRLDEGNDITMLEALYPLYQGYDSVKVKADVEIGGTDQKFNLLMGRRVQRHFGMSEQDIITVPLLVGTDGQKKMSKSFGNHIGITEDPDAMFGKIMSIPDTLINQYYELCADAVRTIEDPREAKLELGKIIVAQYHGDRAAKKAKEEFVRVVSEKGKPTEIPNLKLKIPNLKLTDLLVETKSAASKNEARRLIEQGAVKINDQKKTDPNEMVKIEDEVLLQVGKRKFLRLTK